MLLALAGHTDLRIIGNTITGFQNGVDGIAIAGARNVIIKDNVLRASKPNEGSHVLPVRGGSSSLFRSELRLTLPCPLPHKTDTALKVLTLPRRLL